jgi:uncharacterized membrane protein YfcA
LAIIVILLTANYTVHMFVGGLVSEQVETEIKWGISVVLLLVIAVMAWDVFKHRR